MDISIRKHGQVQLVKLRGTFRLGAAVDEFRSTTESLVEEGNVNIALNLTDVPMMDSSAIGVLVRLMTSAKSHGGGVKLVAPSKLVQQTLKMVGLLNIFEVLEDDNRAIESFGERRGAAS